MRARQWRRVVASSGHIPAIVRVMTDTLARIVCTGETLTHKRASRVATLLAAVLPVAFPSWGAASSRAVRILVAQADATPVAGAHVAALAWETPAQRRGRPFSASPVRKPLAAERTRSDGSVTMRVPDLPVILFDVMAEGFIPRRLSLPRGDDRLVVVVSHAVPTRGHAVWNGVGQEGVTIVWLTEDGAEILRRSGPGGELQVPFVPIGHGQIGARVLDPRFSSQAKVRVARDGTFVVGLSRGQDLDGRVAEPEDSAPAAGATITMGEGWTTRSDEQGRFTIRRYVPGSGEVVARKGSLVGTLTRQSPAEQVTLTPGVLLRGRLRDRLSRRPIAGGLVTADRGGFEAVLTGENGTFELGPGVPIGQEETWISVQHPGFEPLRTAVRLQSVSPIELELAPSPVEGVVVDPEGRPVGGALVQCLERHAEVATVMTANCGETLTDGNGRFRLLARPSEGSDPALGVMRVGFSPTLCPMPAWDSQVEGTPTREARIVLPRGIEVPVRVASEAGEPIAGAALLASTPSFLFRESDPAIEGEDVAIRTDGEGRALLKLSPGSWWVAARAPGYLPEAVPCQSPPPGGLVSLVLRAEIGLAGRVVLPNGAPVPHAGIAVGGDRVATMSDARGGFRLRNLDRGTHRLRVRERGARVDRHVRVPAEDLTLVLRPFGRVIGQVRDAADDSPVRRFSIPSVSRASGQDREFVDRDGRFVLDELDPGKITLEVEADGYRQAVVDVLVPEEGEVEADFRLDRGCWLEAVAVSPGGEPAEWVEVRTTAIDQPAAIPRLDTLSYYPHGVLDRWTWCGPVRMEVSSREYRSASVEVDTAVGGRVEVRLGTPQALRGVILDEAGKPVSGAEVCAQGPGTHDFYPCVVSEDDGSVVLGKLRDDRVSIEVTARGFEKLSLLNAPVSEAEVLRLVLRRPPESPAVVSGSLLGLPEDFDFCEVGAYRGDKKVAEDVVVSSERYQVEFPGGGRVTIRASVCGVRLVGEGFGCLHLEPVEVDARAGQQTEADLSAGSLVLSVRVAVNETPLSWAVVWVKPVWGHRGAGMAVRCDHEGLATGLEPFPVGLFEFEVNSPVLAAPYHFVREIRQSGVVHLDLRPTLLQGAVTGPDGLPVAGAVVDLVAAGAGHPRRVVTGDTGTFRFFDVASGPVRLTVSASGFETRWHDIDLSPTDLADVRIQLSSQ